MQSRLHRAFTLVETLVVVSVIVLILALSAPSLLQTMQASKLSSAGESVVGFFSEAQQLAMSQSVPVEVRFFKYTTPSDSLPYYRSYQMFKITTPPPASGAAITEEIIPVGSVTRLPEGVVILGDTQLSPILSGPGFEDEKPDGSGTYSGVDSSSEPKYNALRYMTDGSCRKVSGSTAGISTLQYQTLSQSFLTLVINRGGGSEEINVETLPKNFYTIQIDPFTGKTRTYRPGQN